MTPIACFLLEPTGRVRVTLRRFVGNSVCDAHPHGMSCHDARVFVDERDFPLEHGYDRSEVELAPQFVDDPRWPLFCDGCQGLLDEQDKVIDQVMTSRVWRAADGREFSEDRGKFPAGAMRDLWWLHELHGYGGPDGQVLCVTTPDGHEWILDGPASNGPRDHVGWRRTGTPPVLTVEPSIQTPSWHGFLERGWLVEQRGEAPP